MIPNPKLLKIALEQANLSKHHHRHGAVLYKGKRILSSGRNHALKSRKHLRLRFTKMIGSVHAEVDAILSAKTDLRGSSILVIRLGKGNELRNSKPCARCLSYLEFVGVKRIIFSTTQIPYFEKL